MNGAEDTGERSQIFHNSSEYIYGLCAKLNIHADSTYDNHKSSNSHLRKRVS